MINGVTITVVVIIIKNIIFNFLSITFLYQFVNNFIIF